MSTSATLTAPGSAARTRIPTACCASTFQRELISACMRPMSLRPSRSPSMRDPERPLAGKRPPRLWTNSSEPSIQGSRQRVLRRPLESALNPAVTIGLWAGGRFPTKDILAYLIAQIVGAIIAASALYLIASGKADYNLAVKGLAANGFGAASPGGYSMASGMAIEIILT